MKKLFGILVCVLILFLLIFTIYLFNKNEKFLLDSKYYKDSKYIEIKKEELEKLIHEEKSFALFIYQPMCVNSSNFEEVLNEFMKESKITIYKIAFSNLKGTNLCEYIKYYPSFILYKDGKMIDYLDANSNEDINIYKSVLDFSKWFKKYVIIK